MPQVPVNSTNIATFGFSVNIDLYNRQMVFQTSPLTVYNGSGLTSVLGIAFSLVDSVGLELMGVDWTTPQIIPHVSTSYTLDLTSSPINFLFQNYNIIGYIKDADGTVYQTLPLLKTVCQPTEITDSGYVCGDFEIIPDCTNNSLTVKEFTVLVYNNQTPLSVTKSGTLYYPTGTISPISFSNTPFSNNVVFTGSYRITNTTVATYDLGDNIYVLVTYYTDSPFPVTCSNFIGDITCCLTDVYNTYQKNCENAIGQAALQKYNSVLPSILNGLVKQINGQDASAEVAAIKKSLNCNCGATSLRQNEQTPTNPAIYSIVLNGVGGTTIPSPTITGNTKTYNIASKSYVVSKGNTGDLAFTITQDTSVTNVVTYKITFNYDVMAGYILTAIANDPTLINQLNSLITATGGSISGLNGGCVIDLTKSNYSASQSVNGSTLITGITINGIVHAAPTNTFANNGTSVASWLNSLSLGTFTAVVASNILTIQSVANTNVISTVTFTTPNVTVQFSATNATLVQVLQAIINWMCTQTSLQIALSNNLDLCTFDYNGNIITTRTLAGSSQQIYNSNVASAICNIVSRINTIAGVTCATFQAIFIDRPNIIFSSADRLYGTLGGNCAGLSDLQIANLVIAAVSKYSSVKTAWCAIDCSTPATCPDISNTALSMVGGNIGVYGITWNATPVASQTVTVKYRVTGTSTWLVSTNALLILPNGSISGTTPYQISGLTAGTEYDVFIQNNCGGNGFISQITTPTGSVYTGSYIVGNVLYSLCGGSPITLYSSAPFATGVTMYTDIGLTTPKTGDTYITRSGFNIFNLNTSTGIVGSDTGTACTTGTGATYVLGNDTSTICSGSPVTLYTNGTFGIGKVLYIDSSLTTPQTGFSYVVSGGIIYTVNSGTGAVTGTSGLSCSPLAVTMTKSGSFSGNLVGTITGGIAPYTFEFNVLTAGACNSYTLGTPTGSTSGTATSTYSAVNYSGVTYTFNVTVTDSVGTVVTSNSIDTPACLVPETMITLKDGSKKQLGSLVVGDELYGDDNKVESFEERTVNKLYIINGGLLSTSEGHVNIVEGELIQSINLIKGSIFTDINNNEVEVLGIEIKTGKFDVINISTTNKTYYANGIKTHNKIACP
jgi:hypothetical protein